MQQKEQKLKELNEKSNDNTKKKKKRIKNRTDINRE